jgi:hypothetical protein
VTVAALMVALVAALSACERDDEDTPGGAGETGSALPASPTASPTGATGAATGTTGTTGSSDGSVEVTAVEYEFRLPDELPTGETELVLHNEGEEPHELVLLGLAEGRTMEDVISYMQEHGVQGRPPRWVTLEARTFARPGRTSPRPATSDLQTGTYLLACFVTTADGELHAELGMLQEVSVGT